jgi:triphosphoribosyl-dephospho-CoA synthase
MTGALPRQAISAAYLAACRLEVRTLKPGNVHIHSEGHRMTVADFDASAIVSAPFITDPALSVGARIHRAIVATFDAVGQNTNLGIVLLCAPLAAAAGRDGVAPLEQKLAAVLGELDHNDARDVYQAIAYANPAGLGEDKAGDVREEPPAAWTLLDAMRAAAGRDMIAHEYAVDFAGVFETARQFAVYCAAGAAAEDALAVLFLRSLAERCDSHIARKHGIDVARRVQTRAHAVLRSLALPDASAIADPEHRERLVQFDAELKSWGTNPGSLADLMCASVFAARLLQQAPPIGRN